MAEKKDAWYATVGHYRAWLFADGGFYDGLKKTSGKFDASLIRRMARYYGVARTIPAVTPPEGEGTPSLDKAANQEIVAKYLNELTEKWEGTLTERAELVIQTANKIRNEIRPQDVNPRPKEAREQNEKGSKRMGPPYSAVSKFIWFAQPNCWTLYDNFASRALLPNRVQGEERVMCFYQQLQKGGFEQTCCDLRSLCEGSDLHLKPERIVDLVLMMRGGACPRYTFARDLRTDCDNFLVQFPKNAKTQLCQAAEAIAAEYDRVGRLPAMPGAQKRGSQKRRQ